MDNQEIVPKLYTGCCGFVYKTNGVRWATALFEKWERYRLKLPKDTPIPTHVFSIVKKDGVLYAAEAVFNEFRVQPLGKYYPPSEYSRLAFFEPAPSFNEHEQAEFEGSINTIQATTKGYDVIGYLAQMLHIIFGINLKVGKGTEYVYCNEAHEYAYNAARSNTYTHAWNDNPLELQLSTYIKKMV
jgi:hypothetical protein